MDTKNKPATQSGGRANNGAKQSDENIRQTEEQLKGDLASENSATRDQAEQRLESEEKAFTSNGNPPKNEPGSHRRH